MYPEGKSEGFIFRDSRNASTATLQLSTSRLSLAQRKAIAGWVRSAFASAPSSLRFVNTDSFYLRGENGFSETVWPRAFQMSDIPKRPLVIAYEMPYFKVALEDFRARNKLDLLLVSLPTTRTDLDGQILSSNMNEGRQIILQDILKWDHVSELIGGAKDTVEILKNIAAKSASTVPIDQTTLQTFESQAISDYSLVPLARRFPTAVSRASAEVSLCWNSRGELSFRPGADCGSGVK
jgi:hypothetical protein